MISYSPSRILSSFFNTFINSLISYTPHHCFPWHIHIHFPTSSTLGPFIFFFSNAFSPNCGPYTILGMRLSRGNVWPLNKTEFLSFRNRKLSVKFTVVVGDWCCISTSLLECWLALLLFSCCANRHDCCGFPRASAWSCPGDNISFSSSLTSGFYDFCNSSWTSVCAGVIPFVSEHSTDT